MFELMCENFRKRNIFPSDKLFSEARNARDDHLSPTQIFGPVLENEGLTLQI